MNLFFNCSKPQIQVQGEGGRPANLSYPSPPPSFQYVIQVGSSFSSSPPSSSSSSSFPDH